MTPISDEVTDTQREHCALIYMCHMLTMLAEREGITFEQALLDFAETPIYSLLFDYESRLWMDGGRYLLAVYDEYVEYNKKQRTSITD